VFQKRIARLQDIHISATERQSILAQLAPADTGELLQRTIPGTTGSPDVRVYVLNGAARGPRRPAILHMHGGGFTTSDARTSVAYLRPLADALDCVLVTVDYRLAPATGFPGSLEDNYAALKWLYHNAVELGVDSSRIAVMGESAGGGHAAMLAIAARDRGEVPILLQALIYPMLDDRTGSTRQMPAHFSKFTWTAEQNQKGWSALLGVPAGAPTVPVGAVPARVADLRGLPPTYIGVGSVDLFVDEDMTYAQRLIDAGIPVELNVVAGAFHGFHLIARRSPSRSAFRGR
jgi:acetyl esterase/lipase